MTLLASVGHRMFEAEDGRAGLAVARAEHPDLVITDVLMPVMDGYELVDQLHLDPSTCGIPVVFYTAHYGEREARALALASGVSYVLTKPVEFGEVLKIVALALSGKSETGTASDTPPPTTALGREHLRLVTNKLSEKAGDLRTANARLRALIDIGVELGSELDPDRLLHSVCDAARDLFGATYVTLGILDLGNRTVERIVTCGADAADWIKIGDPLSGIFEKVVAERRILRGDNPGGDPARVEFPSLHPEVQAFLAAPVVSPARVYGWICFVGNEGRPFTEEDEHLVTALSGQVGRIYENCHFADVSRKRAKELEDEILERKQTAEALRIAEERMRFALEAAGVGIWDMDYATGVLRWSTILESQHGLQPGAFGGTLEALGERVHPKDRGLLFDTMAKANKSRTDFSVQYRSIWPDGTVRWLSGAGRIHFSEHGEPVRGIGISQDVTERRALEGQYQQAQKMEAIGRLAGGVAHDFNNLLTAILGYCELLLGDLDPDDPRQADMAEIQKAGTRAAGLTRQLLAFSRKEIIEPTRLDLNLVVADMRAMLGRLIREDVTIVLGLRPGLAAVTADRGQVEQIIMNLAVNARDAMPEGGTLTIETANVDLDEDYAKAHLAVTPGPHVALTVTDTGTGMTPEVQSHLFEPFFTTKAVGKGTGLGLATVDGIVARSGGSVTAYSEVGRGTSFKVYFPTAGAAEVAVDTPPSVARPRSGTQTVLVVEDADALRELARRLLQRQGYKALVASNAEEALRFFEQHASIDVLLTDVVMPGTSGPELTRQLLELQPALKVIYMSGYTEDSIVQHGVLKPGIAFLHKPFTAEVLGRKLREVLDQ